MIRQSLFVLIFSVYSLAWAAESQDQQTFDSAMRIAVANKTDTAKKILNDLLSAKRLDANVLYLNLGRIEYQENHFDQAVADFSQVDKASDLWAQALEEKAWSYLRMDKKDKALGELRTVLAPQLSLNVGPEPFYLAAYIHLSLCNYSEILELSRAFKARFRDRLQALDDLSSDGKLAAANFWDLAKSGGDMGDKLKGKVALFPRLFWHDLQIQEGLGQYRAMNGAGQAAAQARVVSRLQILAERDLDEMSKFVGRFQILEAEVVQRMSLLADKNRPKGQGLEKHKSDDTLVFPDSNEFWIDELGHYEVEVKDCPKMATGPVISKVSMHE